ncbi:hypothetical protein AURDEDRAFT_114083, partial [Auricularia subglabra TFB-10046 SS5]
MADVPSLRGLSKVRWVALADYHATATHGLHDAVSGTSSGPHDMNMLQTNGLPGHPTPVVSHAFVLLIEKQGGDPLVSCFAGISAFGADG